MLQMILYCEIKIIMRSTSTLSEKLSYIPERCIPTSFPALLALPSSCDGVCPLVHPLEPAEQLFNHRPWFRPVEHDQDGRVGEGARGVRARRRSGGTCLCRRGRWLGEREGQKLEQGRVGGRWSVD